MFGRFICRIIACWPLSIALFAVKGSEMSDGSALFMLIVAVIVWTTGDWIDSI